LDILLYIKVSKYDSLVFVNMRSIKVSKYDLLVFVNMRSIKVSKYDSWSLSI